MKLRKFAPDSEAGKALAEWHRELAERRGDRAALRRAGDGTAAAMEAASHRLIAALRSADEDLYPGCIPAIAAVLAHIKQADGRQSLPLQLAQRGEGGDRPKFSELRLRRLLQSEDRDSLCSALRRAIALLRGEADIYSTAETIYRWGDGMRRDWSYAYFGALASTSKS